MKIGVQTVIQTQELDYMCRWITIFDNQQDDSSKRTTQYNHSMNSSLKGEFMVHFTCRLGSKRKKNISIRLSMVENLGIYNKKRAKKTVFFENFLKNAENSV